MIKKLIFAGTLVVLTAFVVSAAWYYLGVRPVQNELAQAKTEVFEADIAAYNKTNEHYLQIFDLETELDWTKAELASALAQ